MRISLNLATRPYADLRPAVKRLRVAMAVLALTACALGLGLHLLNNKADAARARELRLDAQIAGARQEQQSYQSLMQRPDNAQLLTQIATLNGLFEQKSFSWTLAMEDLETVLPGGVQVATLEPIRAKSGQITLHLRVAGPRDRDVELVRNLEHSRRFLFPRIVGETADAGQGPNQHFEPISATSRVDFDLLAEYNPPAPGEAGATKSKGAAEVGSEAAGEQKEAGGTRGLARPSYVHPKRPRAHAGKPSPAQGGAQ